MTEEYKCPSCGGTIAFDTKSQEMKCPYCDSTFSVESLKEYESVLKEESAKTDSGDYKSSSEEWNDEGLMHYVCPSCGGEIITNETLASTVCPYCSNNVILTDKLSGILKPDLVIPFKKDKKEAEALFRDALKGKRYLNRAFRDEGHIEEIKGVYVPVWLFSSKADSSITYRAVTTTTWMDRNFMYTKTSHYLLERAGTIEFDKIPVDGSKSLNDDLFESLSPYDFSEAVDFKTAYLSGFLADRYDVTSDESKPRATERAKASLERCIRSTITGYTGLEKKTDNISLKDGECRYALLPVWLLNTKWNGKDYLFGVNGQTGKFVGDLPFDKKKGVRNFLLSTLGFGAVFMALFYLVWAM